MLLIGASFVHHFSVFSVASFMRMKHFFSFVRCLGMVQILPFALAKHHLVLGTCNPEGQQAAQLAALVELKVILFDKG